MISSITVYIPFDSGKRWDVSTDSIRDVEIDPTILFYVALVFFVPTGVASPPVSMRIIPISILGI
jgi:hypothetical protein